MSDPKTTSDPDDLLRRIEQLERDNARLREKVEPILGPDNPCFHPQPFLTALNRTVVIAVVPMCLGMALAFAVEYLMPWFKGVRFGGIPLFSFAGSGGGIRGIGIGLISFGGFAIGAIAFGGVSVGLLAFGGGALGVVAAGGGAIGFIAVGGGAVGFIAIGGGATGYYAMGQKAYGKYALGLNRQDQEAIDFFVRFVPGLRRAVTNPLPVIPVDSRSSAV